MVTQAALFSHTRQRYYDGADDNHLISFICVPGYSFSAGLPSVKSCNVVQVDQLEYTSVFKFIDAIGTAPNFLNPQIRLCFVKLLSKKGDANRFRTKLCS